MFPTPAQQVYGRVSTKRVTPEMIPEYLRDFKFEHQRPIRQARVKFLANQMVKGAFDEDSVILFFGVLPDGTLYLLNGQHTLSAAEITGMTFNFTHRYKPCLNLREVGEYYSKIDTQLTRSAADGLKALDLVDELGLENWQINQTSAAISRIMSFEGSCVDVSIDRKDSALRVAYMHEYAASARLFYKIYQSAASNVKNAMVNAAIMSVFLAILKYEPGKAETFVNDATCGRLENAGNPAEQLYLKIQDNGLGKFLSPNHQPKAVAKCWNAFFNGMKMRSLILKNLVHEGLDIEGTPFHVAVGARRARGKALLTTPYQIKESIID